MSTPRLQLPCANLCHRIHEGFLYPLTRSATADRGDDALQPAFGNLPTDSHRRQDCNSTGYTGAHITSATGSPSPPAVIENCTQVVGCRARRLFYYRHQTVHGRSGAGPAEDKRLSLVQTSTRAPRDSGAEPRWPVRAQSSSSVSFSGCLRRWTRQRCPRNARPPGSDGGQINGVATPPPLRISCSRCHKRRT